MGIDAEYVTQRTRSEGFKTRSALLEKQISRQEVLQALSQYDPLLSADASYEKDKSERSTIVFGTESSTTQYHFQTGQLAPTGSEFTFGFFNTKQTSNSAFASSPSLFDSRLSFQLIQPLAKNTFGLITRNTVSYAKQNQKAVNDDVRATIMDAVHENLVAYWEWHASKRLESICRDAQSAAVRLHRTNRQKMVIGLIEETDLYAFAANTDLKQNQLYETEARTAEIEARLRTALNLPHEPFTMKAEPLRVTAFPSVTVMIESALRRHPRYLSLQKSLQAKNILVATQKNARLPEVDLVGSLELNGIDPAYANAVGDIGNGNPVWTGGVQVSFPLLNRNTRAEYKKEQLEKMQFIYRLKEFETSLQAGIREGLKKYHMHRKRLSALSRAMENQRLKWEGEILRYDQGRSDPDLVIRSQNDYLDTQKLYVRARAELELARLELGYVRGEL